MKKVIIFIFLLCSLSAFSQANLFSAGMCHTSAAPAFNPGARGCRTVLDTSTMHYWIWKIGTTWVRQEKAADPIIGCSAPLYTPTKWQSDLAINGCSPIPLLYKHVGAGVWECLNCVTGVTDLTFTGAGPTYNLNSSTGTDVTITQGANMTITRTGNDLAFAAAASTDAQNLSLTGQALSISGGTGVTLPVVGVSAGTGISVGTVAGVVTVTNTGDLSNTNEIQTLSFSDPNLSLSLGGGTVDLSPLVPAAISGFYSEKSDQSPEYKWNLKSSAVRSDHWADGAIGVSFRDTLLSLGGWYNSPEITYDTILYSVNDGVSWAAYPGNLPVNLHTFAFCEMDGYYYIAGGDYLSTATEKKSVWRTSNFRTWQTMTTNAGFGERILSSLVSHGSILYVFGGQSGIGSTGLGYNDVWKSVDNGATWTQIQSAVSTNGFSFLGQNISNQVKLFNGRFYVVGGQYYGPPFTYTNRVFSIPIDKIEDKAFWKQETSLPVSARSYPAVDIWDGKIWVIGGYDGTTNSREICYMAKSGTWRLGKTYYGDAPGTNMSTTHAATITVHRDRLFRVLGNITNDCYMLERSDNIDTLKVNTFLKSRLLTQTGSYTYNSETQGGLASVFGNNIVSGTAVNTIKRLLSDNGNYINMRYDRGIWFGTGFASTVGVEVADITSVRLRILADGKALFSDNFSFASPLNTERVMVDGSLYSTGVNVTGDVAATGTVSGRIGSFTGTAGTALPVPLVATAASSSGGATIARITNTTTDGYTLLTFNQTNSIATPFYMARYGSTYSGTPNLFEIVSTAGDFSFRPFGNMGIGTTSPQRKLHVAGEARITDLTTDPPTQLVGSDADGDLGAISVGSGLDLTAGVLTVTAASASKWTDGGATTYLTATTDNAAIGTTTANSKLDVTTDALGVSQTNTSGIVLSNNTAATALVAQQISPALRWRGQGWKTDVVAASQTVDFRAFVTPIQGTTAPIGYLGFGSSVNGGAYSDNQMVLTSAGNVGIGNSSPSFPLHVGANSGGSGSDFYVNTSTSAAKLVLTSQSAQMAFGANPQVGFANGVPHGASFGSLNAAGRTTIGSLLTSAGGATYLNFSTNGAATGLHVTHNYGSDLFAINSSGTATISGSLGVGNTTPSRQLHVTSSDAITNAVTYTQRNSHITSGTATTGFGLGTETELENGSGTNRVAATEEVTWSDAVDATEDADWKLNLIRAGTLTNALNVSSTGLLQFGGTTSSFPSWKRSGTELHARLADDSGYATLRSASFAASSHIELGSASLLYWASRSMVNSPADGNIRLTNNAQTDFGLLQFGGTTSSFPSIKRSGTGLIARLADDSADAPFTASNITANGTLASTRNTATLGVAATTLAITRNVVTVTGDAGLNVLATITGGQSGQILTLIFVDALVTITDNGSGAANTVNLSAAFVSTAGDVLTLVFDGTSWFEVQRSLN